MPSSGRALHSACITEHHPHSPQPQCGEAHHLSSAQHHGNHTQSHSRIPSQICQVLGSASQNTIKDQDGEANYSHSSCPADSRPELGPQEWKRETHTDRQMDRQTKESKQATKPGVDIHLQPQHLAEDQEDQPELHS